MSLLMAATSCCCFTPLKALLWLKDSEASCSGFQTLRDFYQTTLGLGGDFVVVGDLDPFTDDIHDYTLIIWQTADSNPSWWSEITGGTWKGRLHLTAENETFTGTIDYVNSISSVTGMSITADSIDEGPHNGAVESHPLTAGQTTMRYSATSEVVDGTVLSRTETGSVPWLAQNKPSGQATDFVLAGDANHFCSCSGCVAANANFFENLYYVPI